MTTKDDESLNDIDDIDNGSEGSFSFGKISVAIGILGILAAFAALGFSVRNYFHTDAAGVSVPVPISEGGTGKTTVEDARSNLGLGTMATQAAGKVDISGGNGTFDILTVTNEISGNISGNATTATTATTATNATTATRLSTVLPAGFEVPVEKDAQINFDDMDDGEGKYIFRVNTLEGDSTNPLINCNRGKVFLVRARGSGKVLVGVQATTGPLRPNGKPIPGYMVGVMLCVKGDRAVKIAEIDADFTSGPT